VNLMNKLRNEIVGVEEKVPLLNGIEKVYINFDNAASTPTLKRVLDRINEFMRYYSSIHRGTGFKSKLSSQVYEIAREKAGSFVGYYKDIHTVIFGKNTTEAVNKLSYRLNIPPDAIIISTQMEHHSNDLPWRNKANVLFAPTDPEDGTLIVDSLYKMIRKHREKLFMVSLTGASNVTGNINPIKDIACEVHAAGAYFMVDGAQLVPHKAVSMGNPGDPDSIDFLVYSAHKMYAPFGAGVLVGRKELFDNQKGPEYRGGGTVRIVTPDHVEWDGQPYVDEAGSPNVVGAVALAEAINFYNEIGYTKIEEIEMNLMGKVLERFLKMPDIQVLGQKKLESEKDRLGVIPFNIKGVHHALTAAILSYEFGLGVRNGCFCAHPYIKHLLKVGPGEEERLVGQLMQNDWSGIPGALRLSLGFYNEEWELDRLFEGIDIIRKNKYKGEYRLDKKSGEYFPINYHYDFKKYFDI
jgi:cysteine desulfurase/selenocysteine lyase